MDVWCGWGRDLTVRMIRHNFNTVISTEQPKHTDTVKYKILKSRLLPCNLFVVVYVLDLEIVKKLKAKKQKTKTFIFYYYNNYSSSICKTIFDVFQQPPSLIIYFLSIKKYLDI